MPLIPMKRHEATLSRDVDAWAEDRDKSVLLPFRPHGNLCLSALPRVFGSGRNSRFDDENTLYITKERPRAKTELEE